MKRPLKSQLALNRPVIIAAMLAVMPLAVTLGPTAASGLPAGGVEALVSFGSPVTPFPQSGQDEPAVAVDPMHPHVVAAGANDSIDNPGCNVGNDQSCQITLATAGVGISGVYFSSDAGRNWMQPTHTGLTARDCPGEAGTPADPCIAHTGPIGTLPHFAEDGLWDIGDPGVAFGPVPGPRGFSWRNGSRLYYSTLAINIPGSDTIRTASGRPGGMAVAVSSIDGNPATGLTSADMTDGKRWTAPVIASQQDSTQFSDKDQIWADNARSSRYFGNVYVCFGRNQINRAGNYSESVEVSTSRDGGRSWTTRKLTQQVAGNPNSVVSRAGCTVRTDSHGVVDVFFDNLAFGAPGYGSHSIVRSFDGGDHWTQPRSLFPAVDTCFVDLGGCPADGIAGARGELAAAPSISIANGAPTGIGATDLIVDTWVDGRDGIDNAHVLTTSSSDGGTTWTVPAAVELPGDHGFYAAVAIAPAGTDAYLVYTAFTTPWRHDTTAPRSLVAQVLHAPISGGTVGPYVPVHRGTPGDPRGSSCDCLGEEFLGDYIYAAATDTYAIAIWSDVRNAADCPAVDALRALPVEPPDSEKPAVMAGDCPPTFGNSDIYSWTSAP